jgi:putative membrane-bound dehydrogenase-like protein
MIGRCRWLVAICFWACMAEVRAFDDPNADRAALPTVPAEFEIRFFAREPLVRQPCSLAFDARGRMFVGMGPQYRMPTPTTPGDSVVIVEDTDGDGVADRTREFATGFNTIQGLAWRGRDLWVANAPDLTVVRDLDGDDEADEYVRIYGDLGNLEHALHGLNWSPDGKLYMSKGNSKGYSNPNAPQGPKGPAPREFMKLWHEKVHPDWPVFPPPATFRKNEYKRSYHTPPDDQGREGGVLRCEDGGANLEIVSRGMRNPWDITLDDAFNWIGTDNDGNGGDRIFMPFWNAHFGWSHSWSAHWGPQPHPPTAPVSSTLGEGSGTGIVFCDSPQMPPAYRGVFLINDFLRKTTFVWRPQWDGALMMPRPGSDERGGWQPFVQGGKALFRPTDIEIGPDGSLWILGWSAAYGSTLKNDEDLKSGKWDNEGRIFHVRWKEAPPANWQTSKRAKPAQEWSVAELIEDFTGPLPVWRIDAADELVRRGAAVKAELVAALESGRLSRMQETWTAWTLGRIAPEDATIEAFFARAAAGTVPGRDRGEAGVGNLQLQAIRILAHRIRQFGKVAELPAAVTDLLQSTEPRLRFAAVDAIVQARQTGRAPAVVGLLATETDRVTFYAAWQGLRSLLPAADLKNLLLDKRAGVRRAALLALLETHAIGTEEVRMLADGDIDETVVELAKMRLGGKPASGKPAPVPQQVASASLLTGMKARSAHAYRTVPGGVRPESPVYTDRRYAITAIPDALLNAELVQTANEDDGSAGDEFLTFDVLVPARVHVAFDTRAKTPPAWLRQRFRASDQKIATNDCAFQLYTLEVATPGRIALGGNTDDGRAGGKGNYFVVVEPLPLATLATPTTLDQALAALPKGDAKRGELLFKTVAGCGKCHSLSQQAISFGPQLADIGYRAPVKHIVESIVAPDAHITEGYGQHAIETDDGRVVTGVILAETDLAVQMGTGTLERVSIRKDQIEDRRNLRTSAMPAFGQMLTPAQVADVAAFLLTQKVKPGDPEPKSAPVKPDSPAGSSAPTAAGPPPKPVIAADSPFGLQFAGGKLLITHGKSPVAEFVFEDLSVLRPCFANVHGPKGTRLTRNFPPVAGDNDHPTMHPGIAYGFGSLGGDDFWRNKGGIRHVSFSAPPTATKDRVTFATESDLVSSAGKRLGAVTNKCTLLARPSGWLLIWDATFRSDDADFAFGDAEEMGFCARMATDLREMAGGQIVTSDGRKTAKDTWGRPAAWCDYSGGKEGSPRGITLMSAPGNFRESWWHNRDYGVFVANPFGRAAMKQGAPSTVTVKKGESLRLMYGAMLHDGADYDPAVAYREFVAVVEK